MSKKKKMLIISVCLAVLVGLGILTNVLLVSRELANPHQPIAGNPIVSADLTMDLQPDQYNQWPDEGFPVSTPEAQGVDSSVILKQLRRYAKKGGDLDSFLLLRNGYLVNETYFDENYKNTSHYQASCTKSFLSTLVGIAIQEGYIQSVDQNVIDFFPGLTLPEELNYKNEMTIRHLLTMTSGLAADEKWAEFENAEDVGRAIFLLPQEDMPGKQFRYDTGASHLLGCVLSQAVGKSLYDYAKEKLFDPLGMTNVYWDADKQGNNYGGHGLYLTPEDMLRFGYLYLNNGRWEDRQILSAEWVKQAQPQLGGRKDYGFMFWVSWANIPHNYEANGAGDQHIIIFPELNAVAVTTSDGTNGIQRIYDILQRCMKKEILPENNESAQALAQFNKDAQAAPFPSVATVMEKVKIKTESPIDLSSLAQKQAEGETLTVETVADGLKVSSDGDKSALYTKESYQFPLMVELEGKANSDNCGVDIRFLEGGAGIYDGSGYISLGFSDFVSGAGKPFLCEGELRQGQTFTIKWILHPDFQAIIVDGELCAFSERNPYQSSGSQVQENQAPLGLTANWGAQITLQKVTVSELG
ncbi:MAG: beta-lactamase family protein [Oscillospiraceae bacterium]|jgi:CubicO group peptidase (beta-lactamase class C family)|nr:beta-lactamase family protein [Oscillospiraceae bacterium]